MMTDRKLMGIRARVPIDVRLGTWRLSHFASRTTSLPQSSWTARSESLSAFAGIRTWGRQHLDFLRSFSEFYHGIPCERWLCKLVNRIDPILFGRCFASWVAALWPDRHDLIVVHRKNAG